MISLVIVSYNRPAHLLRTVGALRSDLDASRIPYELVITDDGSDAETLAAIRKLQPDQFVPNPDRARRFGLGYNMNKGCEAARGDYHLILQDDFMPVRQLTDMALSFVSALRNDGIHCCRFNNPRELSGGTFGKLVKRQRAMILNGRLRVVTIGVADRRLGEPVYAYTDNPHMRRADFQGRFGKYVENKKTSETELDFVARYNALGGNTCWVDEFFETGSDPIRHIGDDLSTRTDWNL